MSSIASESQAGGDDFGIHTSDNFTFWPYGFQPKAAYEHPKKNTDIIAGMSLLSLGFAFSHPRKIVCNDVGPKIHVWINFNTSTIIIFYSQWNHSLQDPCVNISDENIFAKDNYDKKLLIKVPIFTNIILHNILPNG